MIRWVGFLLACSLFATSGQAKTLNGFVVEDALVPITEILPGGPPRDGIPAIDNPIFFEASQNPPLTADDRVLGVSFNGVAKAYPIGILNWHEIVNDDFSGTPLVITYCPLCGSGMVFHATFADQRLSFGVSGLLYQSDVLLYDKQTESLWSQLGGKAISGEYKGEPLRMVAAAHTTWAEWQSRYPDTLVLSDDTGYRRDYEVDPYFGYENSDTTYFPTGPKDRRFHPKQLVMGLDIDGQSKAYAFSELSKLDNLTFEDQFAGLPVRVEFNPEHRYGRVLDANGVELPTVIAFWFAWYAFHPDTAVFIAP